MKKLLLALLLLASCTRSEKSDKDALTKVVEVDMRASQAMRDADEAATKGDAGAAVDIIEKRATPAVNEGIGLLDKTSVDTEWGRAKKTALAGILADRKKEMPRYEDAVKTGDLEKMLGAMQSQAEIEKRALATVADLNAGK